MCHLYLSIEKTGLIFMVRSTGGGVAALLITVGMHYATAVATNGTCTGETPSGGCTAVPARAWYGR